MMHPTQSDTPERAWLVATTLGDQPRAEVEDSLRELRALADTARADVAGETLCRLRALQPATYIGRGKALQIAADIQAAGANLVGIGALIEKTFEGGRELLEGLGVPVRALVGITSMEGGKFEFLE